MFKFESNEGLKKEVKKAVIDAGSSFREISKEIDITPQGLNKILNKKNLSFYDVKKILNCIGIDLIVDFQKRDQTKN